MPQADVSGISLIAPILTFLLVALVVGVVLAKTKILGENKWIQVFIALIIASIFISAAGTRSYVLTIVPWVAVLVVSLFFMLLILGFVGEKAEFMYKGIGVIFVIILALVFLFSAFVVFSDVIIGYIPGETFGSTGDAETLRLVNTIYSPRIMGAILLIVVSGIVSWILVRGK